MVHDVAAAASRVPSRSRDGAARPSTNALALGRQHQHAAAQRVGAHRLPLPLLLLLLLLPQLLPLLLLPLLLLPLLPLLRRLRRRQQRRDDRRVVLACRARKRKVAGRVGAGQRRTSSGDRVLWRYCNEQRCILRSHAAVLWDACAL